MSALSSVLYTVIHILRGGVSKKSVRIWEALPHPSPHPNLDQADFFSFQKFIKQARAELDQAQLKLKLELSFT